MPRWRYSRTGPNSGPSRLGLAHLVRVRIQESRSPALEEVLQADEEFRPTSALTNDVLSVVVTESHYREIDRRAARLFLEVELDGEIGGAAGPSERDPKVGFPRGDVNRPAVPPERKGAVGPRFHGCGPLGLPAGGPEVELGRVGERAEHLRRFRLDQGGEAQLRAGHRGVVGPHAVGPTLRDGFQISKAHSPRVLDAPTRGVLDRDSQMSRPQDSCVACRIVKLV